MEQSEVSDRIVTLGNLGSISVLSLRQSLKRDRYLSDPVAWAHERLGEFMWSGQRKMLCAVRDHRRNAFYSCHRIGKSMCMGRIAFWWLDTHPPGEAMVITSAHSAMQVKMALWREMARVHSKGGFPGRMNQTEYYMPMADGREEMVAFGRKPQDNDTTGFQGTYSKWILVLGDEACYIPEALLTGLETLVSNEFSKIVLFGNPDDSTTRFAKVCKPGSGWNVLRFGYLHTPNFIDDPNYEGSDEDRTIDAQCPQEVRDSLISKTWVEERKLDWGEESPLYYSKVRGQFPPYTTDGLIPVQWVQAALERGATIQWSDYQSSDQELGVDVGGGGDKNVIAHRKGDYARLVMVDSNPDTMQTLSNVLMALDESNASIAKVDKNGIGWGACDRAKEMASDLSIKRETPRRAELAGRVRGVMVSESANDKERFANLRAEGYWSLRERFAEGRVILDPTDKRTEKLAGQLCALRYKSVAGRIQVESKKEMKARGVASPDEADSVMLAFLDVKDESEDDWFVFRRRK